MLELQWTFSTYLQNQSLEAAEGFMFSAVIHMGIADSTLLVNHYTQCVCSLNVHKSL